MGSFDYNGLAISELDSRDSAERLFGVLYKDDSIMWDVAKQLATITHNTPDEWFATVMVATFNQIGHPEQVK